MARANINIQAGMLIEPIIRDLVERIQGLELELDELKKRLAEEKASGIKGEVRVRWRYDGSGRGDS